MAWLTELLTRTSPWVGVLCLLLCLVCGLYLGLRGARLRVERRTADNRRTGRRGARRALRLLRRRGYRVLDTEVALHGRVWVDGTQHDYVVRCDALVERRGRRFVAELKGGAEAARIANRRTRRQLLEYACVACTDAILLVDAARGQIHEVRFPASPGPAPLGGPQ